VKKCDEQKSECADCQQFEMVSMIYNFEMVSNTIFQQLYFSLIKTAFKETESGQCDIKTDPDWLTKYSTRMLNL